MFEKKQIFIGKIVDLWIIFILILLPILLFNKAFLLKGIFIYGDACSSFFPYKAHTLELLRDGTLPLWTSYIHNGHPLAAIFTTAAFYPLNILFVFLPSYISWNYSIILHYVLAGVFMYLFLREIGLVRSSALFGGIVFMFNGFFIGHIEHTNMVACGIWLPLILLFIEKAIRNKKHIYSLLAGITLGIQFLAGYPQISLYILLTLFSYIIFYLILGFKNISDFKFVRFITISFIITFIVGIGLFAVQLIPTYELIAHSSRGEGLSYSKATQYSFSPSYLVLFLMPYFYCDPLDSMALEYLNLSELTGYCGILSLIFGIFGILFYRRKYTFYFSLLLIGSLILAFGKYTPFYNLFYHFPGGSFIRAPARFLYLYAFSLSILSSFGMQYLINLYQDPSRKHPFICMIMVLLTMGVIGVCLANKSIILNFLTPMGKENLYTFIFENIILFSSLFTCSSLIIILYLQKKIRLIYFIWIVILLLIVDLFIYWYSFNPVDEPSFHTSKSKTANFLLKDNSLYRIYSYLLIPKNKFEYLYRRDTNIMWWTIREALLGNMGMVHKIQCLHGYTAPLTLSRWNKFFKELYKRPIHESLKQLGCLNVKYLLSFENIENNGLEFINETNYGVRIYKNKFVMPRAFVVHKIKVVSSVQEALDKLMEKEFKPDKYAIVEGPVETHIKELNGTDINSDKVEIVKYLSNEVIINTNLSNNGLLILNDTLYPGWEVYVDLKKERIYQTNYLVRGVFITKGEHRIRFIYNPWTFKLGFFITISTLLITLISWCLLIIKSTKGNKEEIMNP